MITINGRGGFYRNEVILVLGMDDGLRVREVSSSSVPNGYGLSLSMNRAIISIFRINPDDPPYTLRRKIIGVSLTVISRHMANYRYDSTNMEG